MPACSENEGGRWVGREDLPRVITVWNPFQVPALSKVCFLLLKSARPSSTESIGEKREHVDMQSPPNTIRASPHPLAPRHPLVLCSPLTFLGLLTIFLPCSHNCCSRKCWRKNIYQNNCTTPWLSALVSGSCLLCLYFHPTLGPDFSMLFQGFLSICKHKWIFLLSIGSYCTYCLATCCFSRVLITMVDYIWR